MSLFDRLQAAYHSPLGTLLLFLILLFVCELLLYGWLWWKRRQQDFLAARYMQHFDLAYQILKDLKQVGTPQADLWGRQSIVQWASDTYGRCLVLLPELTHEEVLARFAALAQAWKEQLKVPFTALKRYSLTPVWSLVQEGTVRSNGRSLLPVTKHMVDQRLSLADKEHLLLRLAEALAQLHACSLTNGERCYHGALVPRTLFLDLDAMSMLKELWIADSGLAYALGSQRFYQLLQQLRRQVLPMDRVLMQDWIKWLPLLAPEQQDAQRLQQVGPAVDFYAFGGLAVWLFTENIPSSNPTLIDWKQIPEHWHPFIQACLKEDPTQRPTDFHELADWHHDPELSLLAQQISAETSDRDEKEPVPMDDYSMETLLELLHQSHSTEPEEEQDLQRELANLLNKATQAQSKGEWRYSIQLHQKVLKRLPDQPKVYLSLAIAYYEIGEWQRAEEYYEQAKQLDPVMARAFREHVAFRL